MREHADRVYRLAYRLSGNAHDAEDLTQETFIRVFRSLAATSRAPSRAGCTGSPPTCSSTWSAAAARLRMEGLPEDTDRLPGREPDPEQVFSDAHLDPDLQAALDELRAGVPGRRRAL